MIWEFLEMTFNLKSESELTFDCLPQSTEMCFFLEGDHFDMWDLQWGFSHHIILTTADEGSSVITYLTTPQL